MGAALLSEGVKIPRQRIRIILRAIDPEGTELRHPKLKKQKRGIYWVPGTMFVL